MGALQVYSTIDRQTDRDSVVATLPVMEHSVGVTWKINEIIHTHTQSMELALRQVSWRFSYASNYIVFDNVARKHTAVSKCKCYTVKGKN
jgi:hypothetical protein